MVVIVVSRDVQRVIATILYFGEVRRLKWDLCQLRGIL